MVAETLLFSLQPQRGAEGVSRLPFPPGPHLRSSRFSRHPRLRQAPTKRLPKTQFWSFRGFCGEKAQAPGRPGPQGLGARAPSPLETWPTGPWGLDPATLTGVFNFLRCKPMALKTLGCYHNPQSADLERRWMVSEGGALQSHDRRGSRLRSSISAKLLGTWPTSP